MHDSPGRVENIDFPRQRRKFYLTNQLIVVPIELFLYRRKITGVKL